MTKTNMKPPKPVANLAAIDQKLSAFVGLRRAALGKDFLVQATEYSKMIDKLLLERFEITSSQTERLAA